MANRTETAPLLDTVNVKVTLNCTGNGLTIPIAVISPNHMMVKDGRVTP